MVGKPPPSPQKILLKIKKRVKIKKKHPPASENLWECDANQVLLLFGLMVLQCFFVPVKYSVVKNFISSSSFNK